MEEPDKNKPQDPQQPPKPPEPPEPPAQEPKAPEDDERQKKEMRGLIDSIFSRDSQKEPAPPKIPDSIKESSLFEKTSELKASESDYRQAQAEGVLIQPGRPARRPRSGLNFKQVLSALFSSPAKTSGLGLTGLDIGTSAIKAVQFRNVGTKKELASLAVEEFLHKDFEGPDRDKAEKEILIKLKRLGKLDGQCIVTFHDPDLTIELIRLPIMPVSEQFNAVVWELKERYSFDPEVSVFDWTPLGEIIIDGERQQEIAVAISPKRKIIHQLEILNSAGVKAAAIEPMAMAVYESFENNPAWKPEEAVAMLDLGAKYTTINFIKDNLLYYNRLSHVGGESMTKAIADYCQMEYGLAEHHKREFGISKMVLEADRKTAELAGEVRVKIAHALGLFLEQLYSEIERSFRFFSYEICTAPVEKIDRFVLSGGGAQLKNFPNFLSARFGAPIEMADPLAGIEAPPDKFDIDYLKAVSSSLAASVGLALRKNIA